MSNVKATLWRFLLDGAHDITAQLQSVADSGEAIIKLPVGRFKTTAPLTLRDGQQLVGSGMGRSDGSRGTVLLYQPSVDGAAIQVGDGEELTKFVRVKNLRLIGPGAGTETTGIRAGFPTVGYCGSNLGIEDVVTENFGVGRDIYGFDNSFNRGGALYSCGIGGRTAQNSFNEVTGVDLSGNVVGWDVTTLGGGAVFNTAVWSNNQTHLKLRTGARVKMSGIWVEGTPGSVACVDAADAGVSNARLLVEMCQRPAVSGETIPFVKMAGGFLKFSGCNGAPELNFEVDVSCQVLGEGEAGIKNGQSYTAGSY